MLYNLKEVSEITKLRQQDILYLIHRNKIGFTKLRKPEQKGIHYFFTPEQVKLLKTVKIKHHVKKEIK